MPRKAERWDMSPARKEPDKTTYIGRFAVRLRTLRERAGYTVPELTEQTGIPEQTIYNWESGHTFPQVEQLLLLANVLGLKSTRTLLPER
jgi:transcriptional regulator with XRE-family HTH domain